MKFVFKFTDGVKAIVDNFEELPRNRNGADILDSFQSVKDNDKPINLSGENGTAISRTGKDLASIEIIFD